MHSLFNISIFSLKDNTLALVKLADFGLSDFYRPGATMKSTCGTLSFLAPEVFKGTSNAGRWVLLCFLCYYWYFGILYNIYYNYSYIIYLHYVYSTTHPSSLTPNMFYLSLSPINLPLTIHYLHSLHSTHRAPTGCLVAGCDPFRHALWPTTLRGT